MVLDTATQVGHMLRTKLSHVNEGGVAAGIQKLYYGISTAKYFHIFISKVRS